MCKTRMAWASADIASQLMACTVCYFMYTSSATPANRRLQNDFTVIIQYCAVYYIIPVLYTKLCL